jgi:hypothetical protein
MNKIWEWAKKFIKEIQYSESDILGVFCKKAEGAADETTQKYYPE